jgi:hypothetical protein
MRGCLTGYLLRLREDDLRDDERLRVDDLRALGDRDDEDFRPPDERDEEDFRPPDERDDDERFDGTFFPSRRASDRPMAIACLRLVTFLPLRPLFSFPVLRSCIARSTFLLAPCEYLRAMTFSWLKMPQIGNR